MQIFEEVGSFVAFFSIRNRKKYELFIVNVLGVLRINVADKYYRRL